MGGNFWHSPAPSLHSDKAILPPHSSNEPGLFAFESSSGEPTSRTVVEVLNVWYVSRFAFVGRTPAARMMLVAPVSMGTESAVYRGLQKSSGID